MNYAKIYFPTDLYKNFGYLCMTCGDWFKVGGYGWNELEFRESEEECASKQLKFPSNCGHWFCIPCSRCILFWDETRYHLSPVPYRCPSCPNKCINPVKGGHCYCEEYDSIQEDWEQAQPHNYKEWRDSEDQSIELSETVEGSVFGSKICPLCRKKYTRV